MSGILEGLRRFSLGSVIFRLVLAQAVGAAIGYGRARKKANAGLRTYMLTCIGAALTMLISMYEHEMLNGPWAYAAAVQSVKFDMSRFSAQVGSGIGFLAAGTIIAAAHRQVSGLTSAIGLFATASLGIACGAGFYECVFSAMILIIFTMEFMQPMELAFKRRLRNITIYVEFQDPRDVDTITETIKRQGARLYDLEMERTERQDDKLPSAIMTLKLGKQNASHSAILSSLAELPCVDSVLELIA
ncbi:MAG: MgtC/SapB family protein [Clostridia bacterium]|nr:MgtC/SapB family protein [Clostridia bacterium]